MTDNQGPYGVDPQPWVQQGERTGYWRAIGHLLAALALYALGLLSGWYVAGIVGEVWR